MLQITYFISNLCLFSTFFFQYTNKNLFSQVLRLHILVLFPCDIVTDITDIVI
jgi:hypothetical protein